MSSLRFWSTWPSNYQRMLLVMAMVMVASLVTLIAAFIGNPEPVYSWQQFQDLHQQEIPVHHFELGGFNFTVFTDNIILFERWATNPIQVNLFALDIYFVFFSIAMVMLLAIITVLRRFWFFVGAGMIIFFLASFEWETLLIAGQENKWPTAVVITIVLGACVFYQYFRSTAVFLERIIVFALIMVAIGAAVYSFSNEPQPLRYLAINTLPAAILLLVIFIVMVAHEIIGGFVTLAGQSRGRPNNLINLLIISGVYLLNLWLAYWDGIGWLDWGLSVSPILILCTSAVLAIWGIRQRQPQYEQIIASDPFAVYFILSLGIISISVIGYFLAAAHDVAILSVTDLIVYAHIGYGTIFLAYIGSNFVTMLMKNLPVQKVLYKPTAMPYFTYRFAGLVFTLAFLFYNTWTVPYVHFASTWNAAIGDLFYSEKKNLLALGYYERAHSLIPYNQHAATALANLELNNSRKAESYLVDANRFKPTEFTLMNYAYSFHQRGKVFDEIIFLEQARKELPQSSIIMNNLGLDYLNIGLYDSAYYYLSEARKKNITEASSDMNLLGLLAKRESRVNIDSLYNSLHSENDRVKSNALAIANQQGKMLDVASELPEDSILNLFSAARLGNFITNRADKSDTALFTQCIALGRKKENRNFKEMLFVPVAHACYSAGQVNRAFQLLQELAIEGNHPGKHNHTMALWALDQEKPSVAAGYVQYSLNQNFPQAGWIHAVTLAEIGKTDEAIIAWDTLGRKRDPQSQALAESMKRVLGAPESWFSDFTEQEKYQYIRYRVPLADTLRFESLLSQISDEDLKAKTILDRSKKWYDLDDVPRAWQIYQKLQGLHLTDNLLFGEIKYFELYLFASRGYWQPLQEQIQKGMLFGRYREHERIYFEAVSQWAAGDNLHAAKNFLWLGTANSFFDDGVVSAASFFQNDNTNLGTTYTILSEALQVNPQSIKILKAYIPIAFARGYDPYALSSMQTLKSLLTNQEWVKYIRQHKLEDIILP